MAMTNINIRIDADKKLKAQELFSSLGLDMTTAINLFIQQSLEFNGIPFTIRKYNAETEAAFAEVEEMKNTPNFIRAIAVPMNYLRIWINEIYNQTHKSIQKRF